MYVLYMVFYNMGYRMAWKKGVWSTFENGCKMNMNALNISIVLVLS